MNFSRWVTVLAVLMCTVTVKIQAHSNDTIVVVPGEATVEGFRFPIHIDGHFTFETLTTQLSSPRMLHFYNERLLVGSWEGNVYWLDPPYRKANLLVHVGGFPHSVVVHKGRVYVARTDEILAAEYDPSRDALDSTEFSHWLTLPGGRGHASRTLRIGPDNRLYISLGITGNCSNQYLDKSYPFDDQRGGLFVIDDSDPTPRLVPYAAGLRNPVGFDWSRQENVIYASNHGPDHLGFHQPPEQLVRITKGSFHGMPWYQHDGQQFFQDRCVDTEPPRPISDIPRPLALFPARNAPMGVAVLNHHENSSEGTPNEEIVVVALHGSWATADAEGGTGNPALRREPALVQVRIDADGNASVEPLLNGFQLDDGRRWGRPTGVAERPDGHIYFTSDSGLPGLFRLRRVN